MLGRYPAAGSGTMARCPHRSTARARASWTTSSCCSRRAGPRTNFDVSDPGHHAEPPARARRRAGGRAGRPRGPPPRAATADRRSPRWPRPAYGPFRRLHLTPAAGPRAVRRSAGRAGRRPRSPTTTWTLVAEKAAGRDVVLLALNGTGTPQDVSPVGLVRVDPGRSRSCSATDHGPRRRRPAALPRRPRLRPRARPAGGRATTPPATCSRRASEGEWPEEIAAIVDQDQPGEDERGFVVFFTGLSGSGKSTLARALHDLILEDGRRTVTSLDGDVVRRNLSAGLTFSREDRETNIRRIGWVAAEIARHRGIAICSPIAPFDRPASRSARWWRTPAGTSCSCTSPPRSRSASAATARASTPRPGAGEIPEFTGISSPYEEPDGRRRAHRHHRPLHRGVPRRA